MRRMAMAAIGMTAMLGMWGVRIGGQGAQAGGAAAQEGRGAAAAAPAPAAPKDKAGYWADADIQNIWKNLEAKGVINQRVADGGAFSINIRIVKEGDAPLVHASSADVWVVQAGTATSITGGTLVGGVKRPGADDEAGKSIDSGVERPLKAGDILFCSGGRTGSRTSRGSGRF